MHFKVTPNTESALCIIGAGRVGSALTNHFLKSNLSIHNIIEKNEERHSQLKKFFPGILINTSPTTGIISKSNLFFIAVQDDQLPGLIEQIYNQKNDLSQKIFVHTSGVHSSQILEHLKNQGAQIASAHPIYSFGVINPHETTLKGVYFDIEGDTEANRVLKSLFQMVGINTIEVTPNQKMAIHIASVFYSNYFVGLTQLAQSVLHTFKIPQKNYWQPFLPLIQSTMENLSSDTPEKALTGPIQRGDIHTIEKHLSFLEENLPEVKIIYTQMARSILNSLSLSKEVKDELTAVLIKYDPDIKT